MLHVLELLSKVPYLRVLSVAVRKQFSSAMPDIVLLAPVPPSWYDALIAKAAPIFSAEVVLARCFPPCTSGARLRAFRARATHHLQSGLSVLALDTATSQIAGGLFAGPQRRRDVIGVDPRTLGAEEEDPLEKHKGRLLNSVYQRLDLFSVLDVSEIVDFAYLFVDKAYREQGLPARLMMEGCKLAAKQNFRAIKGEIISQFMEKIFLQAGVEPLCSVPLKEYRSEGKTIFADAKPPEDNLLVFAGRLQNTSVMPYIIPLTESDVAQARQNYMSRSESFPFDC